jgi:RNA polymerase sigma-70 factor (ECF subfamily)
MSHDSTRTGPGSAGSGVASPDASRRPPRGLALDPSPGLEPGADIAGCDAESRGWVERLRTAGPERETTIQALHALLLKGARFEINRRGAAFPQLRGNDRDDLAQQSADDALVAVLGKLGEFRGESRFTTWAYKFALFEAATKVRRRAWQGRELPLEPEGWDLIAGADPTAQQDVETKELFGALQEAIESDLSAHQREVLVAVTLNDVPIDVLAERLNTTRGALYKTIHDARRKLRETLAARDLSVASYLGGS